MVANAGTIEAQLILNASNFQKTMQAIMADINKLNKNVTSAGSAATKSFSGAGESLTAFDKKLNTAQSHASALGNALTKEAKKISSALSSITPGDALAKQFNLGSRSILTMRNEAIAFNKEFRRLDSVAQNMGKQMKGAYPIEHIEKASLAQQKLNKQVIEASSSFAATGRSFQAAQAPIAGTGNAISNALQKGGNAITKMGN